MQSRLFKKFFITTSVIFIAGITFLSAILGVVFANFYVNNIRDGLYNNCVAVNEAYDGGNEVGKGPFFGLTAALASKMFQSTYKGYSPIHYILSKI